MSRKHYYLKEISKERNRQDNKWGEQNHHILQWFAIIGEEWGEVNKAWNEYKFGHVGIEELKTEAIQTCACIVAMLESIDRNSQKGNE